VDRSLHQVVKVLTPEPAPPSPAPPSLSVAQRDVLEKLLAALKNHSDPQTAPFPTPPVDEALSRLIHHPSVILILGHRGSGKSALAVRLQELLRDVAPAYAIGLPGKASRLLPDWYGLADDTNTIPPNAIIYIPESYRFFHARGTQSSQGRAVGDLVNLSRHRRHTLIFDVQNPAHLDRNIVSEADIVLVKEPGPLQQGFERAQFKRMMDAARVAFAGVGQSRRKRAVWVVAPAAAINGQLMENVLPTFWRDPLSRIFGDTLVGVGNNGNGASAATGQAPGNRTATPRPGKRTSVEDRREKARRMCAAGYSLSEIGKALGISKSYVYKLNQPG